jgi:hypothetical protein
MHAVLVLLLAATAGAAPATPAPDDLASGASDAPAAEPGFRRLDTAPVTLDSGDEERLVFRRVLTTAERAWYARTLQAVIDAIGERCEPIPLESPASPPALPVALESLVPDTAELLPEGAFPRARILLRCESARVLLMPFATTTPRLPISTRVVQRGESAFLFRVFERASLAVSAGPSEAKPSSDLAPIRSVVLSWQTPWAADALRLARNARWGAMSYALRARLARAPGPPPSCTREGEATPAISPPATLAAETEVLEAVLRHHTGRAPAGQLVETAARGHALGAGARDAAAGARCLFPTTLDAFIARTAAESRWPDGLTAAGFDLRSRDELLAAHRTGGGRLEAVFPASAGYVTFSRVALDPTGAQAIVSIAWIRGKAGSGATYVLERREGEWAVLYVGAAWASER